MLKITNKEVTVESYRLLSCSDYHKIYELNTKEKYPICGCSGAKEVYLELREDSPDLEDQDGVASYTEVVFQDIGDDWVVAAKSWGRYSILAIAFKETPESDKFLSVL